MPVPNPFHIVKQQADDERSRTIDPRHEELPHGDGPWPYWNEDQPGNGNDLTYGAVLFIGGFLIFLAALFLLLGSFAARSRDLDGHWAQANPALHGWIDSLASKKGLCCSMSDGLRIDDVDWDTDGNHYRVHIGGKWIVVPDEAVVDVPNKAGFAMVWPYAGPDGEMMVRCFLPGSGA